MFKGKKMKKFVLLFSGLGMLFAYGAVAGLMPVAFPKTIEDVPFVERIENKKLGYEPYKDSEAYHGRNIIQNKPDTPQSQQNNNSGNTNNGNSGDDGSGNGANQNGNDKASYYIVQCRTTYPHINKYMATGTKQPVSFNAVLTQDEYLECSTAYHKGINKCFTPCDKSYTGTPGRINQELDGVIPSFCAGNGIVSEKNAVLFFANPESGRTAQIYTKEQVDAVLEKISGYYPECGTNGHRWYWYLFVFESRDGGKTVVPYGDYKTIGK